ncbi:homoserine/threonine efflux transporter [Dyella sp.]|uniref:homoserine/threonine efflux transporter n=1 Tax=Dyella sp. TaxID=1869338 RepID=UPI002D784B79|nr:homoserine/threonine efflux transporter [Dyella sp.]HET6433389.1 homoserine/threonine efflux transporter [Dyella sp.]
MGLFLTIALVHLLALASPGPDFLFVSQTAASRSRTQALAGVLGIVLGIAVWAALALLGLHVLLQRLAWLQRTVAIAGGAYLLWMGWQLLRAAWRQQAVVAGGAAPTPSSGWRSLRDGLLTNLGNPKAVVYFASVFSALVGPAVTAATRWQLWLLVSVESLAWFVLVATLFALPPMRRAYLRKARVIDALAGAVFVLFGLQLMLG